MTSQIDIVNAFFRRHYPTTLDEEQWNFRGDGWEYNGPGRESRIFPEMVCRDGFKMSVQGHFGAYSYPRDDFGGPYNELYREFEIQCHADEPLLLALNDGEKPDHGIYGYVPLAVVLAVIEKHGGLAEESTP